MPQASIVTAQRVGEQYRKLPKPPDLSEPDESYLNALVQKSAVYSEERADLAPFNHALVAWPEEGSSPVDIADILPEADRIKFERWREHLLVDNVLRQ